MSQQRATFILRLWRQPDAPPGAWLSEVEHLQGEGVSHHADLAAAFHSIHSLLDEMEKLTDDQSDGQSDVTRSIND